MKRDDYYSSGSKFRSVCIALLVAILLLILLLYFTAFRPRPPKVVPTPPILEHIEFALDPKIKLSITLGLEVLTRNPNYAPFRYKASGATVYYRGIFVGWAPIPAGKIPARKSKVLHTSVNILAERLIASPDFLPDVEKGSLVLVSESRVEGNAAVLGVLKLHVSTLVTCHSTVFVLSNTVVSSCETEIKL